jgi:PA14 domain
MTRISLALVAALSLVASGAAGARADTGSYVVVGQAAAAASIVVTTLADSGPGSLRNALDQSNGDGVPSVITFSPSLKGGSILVRSMLPGLDEGGTTLNGDIDGNRTPDIELNGELLADQSGLFVSSSSNVIRGLAINRFGFDGIDIGGNGNRIEYCSLGTDSSGRQSLGNGGAGVRLEGGASGNQVGPGNVIAHNAFRVGPQGGVAVLDGALFAYPDFAGLRPDYVGVFPVLEFPGTRGAFTSADGITPIDGAGHPFADTFGARFTGTLTADASGDYTFALRNPDDVARVVVDGAVIVEGGCMTEFGCNDRSVTAPVNAGTHQIEVDFFDGPGAAGFAVEITGPGAVHLNTNGQSGLRGEFFQLRIPSERNRITRNSIFDNAQLGIELDALEDPQGVNPNDRGDGDVGPNTALNFPILTSAVARPGRLTVKGSLDIPNPRTATIEFFASPVPTPGGDPSGHGEGAVFLGTARPNQGGDFTAALPAVSAGTLISATATAADGNTSEFSANIAVTQ